MKYDRGVSTDRLSFVSLLVTLALLAWAVINACVGG